MRESIDNYQLNEDILKSYGFAKIKNSHQLKKKIDDDLYVVFTITKNELTYQVYERDTDQLFLPFTVKNAIGSYIGSVRDKVESFRQDILNHCYQKNNLKEELLIFVKEKYQTKPIYPWENDLSCTLNLPNGKWYGLLMEISAKLLGLAKDEKVTILNLKNTPEIISKLIDNKNYFPAYHMNKKYWFTILLNNNINIGEIEQLITESYKIVIEKHSKKSKSKV